MNNRQVEYFIKAAEHLNFSRVAEEFFTTQPTISRQISAMEKELGFPLFTRDKGAVRLTAGGTVVYQFFKKAEKDFVGMLEHVERVAKGLEGKLSIGYGSHMNTDIFVHPPAFAFARKYPGIDISVEATTFSGLRSGLSSGRYDIIYTHSFEIPALDDDIVAEKSYAITPMITLSNSHPLAAKPDLRATDFNSQTFLLVNPAESPGRADALVEKCERLGIKNIAIRNMENLDSVMFGIRSGWGVALLSTDTNCAFDSRYTSLILPRAADETPVYIALIRKKNNMNPIIPLYTELSSDSAKIDVFVTE